MRATSAADFRLAPGDRLVLGKPPFPWHLDDVHGPGAIVLTPRLEWVTALRDRGMAAHLLPSLEGPHVHLAIAIAEALVPVERGTWVPRTREVWREGGMDAVPLSVARFIEILRHARTLTHGDLERRGICTTVSAAHQLVWRARGFIGAHHIVTERGVGWRFATASSPDVEVRPAPHTQIGPLTLDAVGVRGQRDGRTIHLTATEAVILRALHAAGFLERSALARLIGPGTSQAALDTAMSRLRRKTGRGVIRTVRGRGYAIESVTSGARPEVSGSSGVPEDPGPFDVLAALERKGWVTLHGPPGSEKTRLARAVASRCDARWFDARGLDTQGLRRIARERGPTIVDGVLDARWLAMLPRRPHWLLVTAGAPAGVDAEHRIELASAPLDPEAATRTFRMLPASLKRAIQTINAFHGPVSRGDAASVGVDIGEIERMRLHEQGRPVGALSLVPVPETARRAHLDAMLDAADRALFGDPYAQARIDVLEVELGGAVAHLPPEDAAYGLAVLRWHQLLFANGKVGHRGHLDAAIQHTADPETRAWLRIQWSNFFVEHLPDCLAHLERALDEAPRLEPIIRIRRVARLSRAGEFERYDEELRSLEARLADGPDTWWMRVARIRHARWRAAAILPGQTGADYVGQTQHSLDALVVCERERFAVPELAATGPLVTERKEVLGLLASNLWRSGRWDAAQQAYADARREVGYRTIHLWVLGNHACTLVGHDAEELALTLAEIRRFAQRPELEATLSRMMAWVALANGQLDLVEGVLGETHLISSGSQLGLHHAAVTGALTRLPEGVPEHVAAGLLAVSRRDWAAATAAKEVLIGGNRMRMEATIQGARKVAAMPWNEGSAPSGIVAS